jgi:exopolysaccharide biosynthesis protein
MNRTKMRFKELRKWCKLSLVCIGLITTISCQKSSDKESLSTSKASTVAGSSRPLLHKIYELPKATIHTLLIPVESKFKIDIAVSDTLETVEDFAKKTQAVAVINGGFFDPVNSQTTSYIVQQGKVVADPSKNPRLMDNPPLKPYLEKILNRSEFRRYQCDTITKYAIAYHQDPVPENCQLSS